MKAGKTLTELAQEIERQAETKRDFIAQPANIEMRADRPVAGVAPYLHLANTGDFSVRPLAHAQIAEVLGIPKVYYDRMLKENPELLAKNVNTWLAQMAADPKSPGRMVRTLDGEVRAFLSDRYRPLENIDLAEAVLPMLMNMDLMVVSAEITERRLYIKAVDKSIERDIPAGYRMGDGSHVIFDTLVPAISISNSEVGFGALAVEAGVYTKGCTNLAMFGHNIRKYHTGAKAELSDDVYAILTDKTKRLTDAAVWSQVQDVVKAGFERARFDALVDKIAETNEQKIDASTLPQVVEVTGKRFGLSQGEQKSVLTNLIASGQLSRYGLFNAVTRAAEDVDDYDRATELERIGGRVIELGRNEWQEIAAAA